MDRTADTCPYAAMRLGSVRTTGHVHAVLALAVHVTTTHLNFCAYMLVSHFSCAALHHYKKYGYNDSLGTTL
jgi:hypothetical protein